MIEARPTKTSLRTAALGAVSIAAACSTASINPADFESRIKGEIEAGVGDSGSGSGGSSVAGYGDGGGGSGGFAISPSPASPTAPDAGQLPAPVGPTPTLPGSDGGATLGWSAAPPMGAVRYTPKRDSVLITIPAVAKAVEYRAIVVSPTLGVSSDGAGHETVTGATYFCAGYLQRNTRTATHEVMQTIEVTGVTAAATVVVEALDTTCPFVGVMGATHVDLSRTTAVASEIQPRDSATYRVVTEAEVNAAYGATIFNGQAAASQTGQPAPMVAPTVLARTTVVVSPLGTAAAPPVRAFFDDFATSDQPKLISSGQDCNRPQCNHPNIDIFQNAKWTFGAAGQDVDQFFIDRGQLHVVEADNGADVFSSAVAFPRGTLAQMSDATYLHVTYDVNSMATSRRYWWISVCGADLAGKTMAADGSPSSYLNPDSSLQLADGNNPNLSGFNCIMLFPKDGQYVNDLPVGDGTSSPPEEDMRVLVYKTGRGVTGVNVSPDEFKDGYDDPSWYRMLDAKGNFAGRMLDYQNYNSPTTHFDVYVRRGRVVVYADGRQKLCNDFAPSIVTMAEAMVGFGQVFYHAAAEHNDLAPASGEVNGKYPRMYEVFDNLKYFDKRDWDSAGFDSAVQAPADFDPTVCYMSSKH